MISPLYFIFPLFFVCVRGTVTWLKEHLWIAKRIIHVHVHFFWRTAQHRLLAVSAARQKVPYAPWWWKMSKARPTEKKQWKRRGWKRKWGSSWNLLTAMQKKLNLPHFKGKQTKKNSKRKREKSWGFGEKLGREDEGTERTIRPNHLFVNREATNVSLSWCI